MMTVLIKRQVGKLGDLMKIRALITLLLLIVTSCAYADIGGNFDDILLEYQTASSGWAGILIQPAQSLFWLLATIQFAWAMIGLAFRATDFNAWISTIVQQIMVICFFYWLLMNSSGFAEDIVNSFKQAGAMAANVQGVNPTDIFGVAIELVKKILDEVSILSPADSLSLLISAIIIVICFALIAAFAMLAIIESYVVIYASVLLMGFGGSQWTREYAIRTLQYAVSVGAKVFILTLLLGIGNKIFQGWLIQFDQTKDLDILLVIGSSVVFLALVRSVPDLVQGIINGSSVGTGGALTSATSAVGGAAMGAIATVGGQGAAAASSFKLASEQLRSSSADSSGSSTQGGRGGSTLGMIGQVAKNYGGELAKDLGGRLTGQASSQSRAGTSVGGRMASSMNAQTESLRAKRESGETKNPGNKGQNDENTIK